jgi:hypothetical protein
MEEVVSAITVAAPGTGADTLTEAMTGSRGGSVWLSEEGIIGGLLGDIWRNEKEAEESGTGAGYVVVVVVVVEEDAECAGRSLD